METNFALTDNLDVLLPITLLFLCFLLKLMIGRNVDGTTAILSLCELPVDVIFLALTFLSAFIISQPEHSGQGLLFLVLYLVIAIGIVFVWRHSVKLFHKGAYWAMFGILLINFIVSIYFLNYSTRILSNASVVSETIDEVKVYKVPDGNIE